MEENLSPVGGNQSANMSSNSWVLSIFKISTGQPRGKLPTLITPSGKFFLSIEPGNPLQKPFIFVEQEYAILFDGHLYNKVTIEQELLKQNITPSGNIAEILFHAYQLHGKNLFTQLKGCFVLLIWDSKEEILLAGRDHIGIYPLFFTELQNGILFSLSIEALLNHPEVSKTLDRAVIADFLSLRWTVDNLETVYKNIKRIPPGHFGEYTSQRLKLLRYWNPVDENNQVNWIETDAQEQFIHLMYRTIDDFLNFGPSAIFLSGGLDSVTTAVLASDQARRRGLDQPHGFSLIFPTIGKLEEPVQRGVTKGLGMPLEIKKLDEVSGEQGLLRSALEINQTWPVPMLNFWRPAYIKLAEAAKRIGKKIIITGTGGDEWLGLTPFYAADLFRKWDFRGLYRLIRGMQVSYPLPLHTHLRNALYQFGLRPVLASRAAQIIYKIKPKILINKRINHYKKTIPDWFRLDPELTREIDFRIQKRVEESLQTLIPQSFYLREIAIGLDHALTSIDLEEEFVNSQRLGIPILGFYQHPDMVDFLFRVSPEMLNTGGPSKGLVRSFVAQRFPDLGLQRQKKIGAGEIFQTIVLNESPRAWKQLGGTFQLDAMGIVDKNRVNTFFNLTTQQKSPGRNIWMIWHLLDIESWVRAH